MSEQNGENKRKRFAVLSGRVQRREELQMFETFRQPGNLNLCEIYGLLLFFIDFKQF